MVKITRNKFDCKPCQFRFDLYLSKLLSSICVVQVFFRFSSFIKLILVAALAFNAIGTPLLYKKLNKFAKAEMKKKMAMQMSRNDLSRLAFSKKAPPALIDEGKEILLGGMKYDIISVASSHDSLVYYCVLDARESKLLAEFKKSFLDEQSGNKTAKHIKTLIDSELQPAILNTKYYNKNANTLFLFAAYRREMKTQCFVLMPDPPPKA